MNKENVEINCHYRDAKNQIKFFCDITYRQGIEFILTVHSKEEIILNNGCFTCYDGANNRYILNNLRHKDNPRNFFYDKRYYFQSLIIDTNKHYIGEKILTENKEIKFKTIYFTMPYINTFFYNIDSLYTENTADNKPSLQYNKNCDFTPIIINGFTIEILSGYKCSSGKRGSAGGYFNLIKSIKISSDEYRDLPDFVEIITTLANFFSICLKRKILISKIWSDKKDNTFNSDFEIKTFQYYVLNKDYQDDISPFKILATYALLKENFENIVNKYFQSKQEPYETFPVFCDLYMRYNDAPVEILPQMKFLPLMQGIEAYVGSLPYNQLAKVPPKSKKALKKFKNENAHLPRINEIDFWQQLPFQIKINNAIENLKIENIINFKLDEKKNYKLINQMVKIRNYYTHYGKLPKIDDDDFYDAMEYTQIICEILIMKKLNFTEEQIKISLSNNYYYLRQWNNKYCFLKEDNIIPKGFEDKIYVGEADCFVKDKYTKYALFYKLNKNNNQVELYAKNLFKYGRTRTLIVDINLTEKEKSKLDKIFQRCYNNFLESEDQLKYRNELKNKKEVHRT